MTTLRVEHPAAELGIVAAAAAILVGLRPTKGSTPELDASIDQLMEKISRGEPAATTSGQGFRQLFARMGYPDQIPAGERLVTLLQKRGFKRIDPVVDSYNVVAAEYCAGIGMHDAAALTDDVTVTRANGDEMIVPIFKTAPARIVAGDLIYKTGNRVMAWLGKRDVDSDEFKVVTGVTTSVLLVVLGNAVTTEAENAGVIDRIAKLIRSFSPDLGVTMLPVVRE